MSIIRTLLYIVLSVILLINCYEFAKPVPVTPTSVVPQVDIQALHDEVQDFRNELDNAVKDASLKVSHKDIDAWSAHYQNLLQALKYVHADTKKMAVWDKARKDLGYCHGQLEIIKKQKVLSSMHHTT